eukprot:TRINITY_DN112115_c0_g1_i1.p1 TRINITY_DN112115_c0_g1~~TRINITY_DN112115_c0_g1_i1.p1  ORF type:complete len:240 (+),score=37.00 TRINITY_DN112115_c0_g1_i1:108-827(+)
MIQNLCIVIELACGCAILFFLIYWPVRSCRIAVSSEPAECRVLQKGIESNCRGRYCWTAMYGRALSSYPETTCPGPWPGGSGAGAMSLMMLHGRSNSSLLPGDAAQARHLRTSSERAGGNGCCECQCYYIPWALVDVAGDSAGKRCAYLRGDGGGEVQAGYQSEAASEAFLSRIGATTDCWLWDGKVALQEDASPPCPTTVMLASYFIAVFICCGSACCTWHSLQMKAEEKNERTRLIP